MFLSGASPFGAVALAYGAPGDFTIPGGSCGGTVLDLASPTLAGLFGTDATGTLSLSFNAPAGLCGLSIQAVDLTTCEVGAAATL